MGVQLRYKPNACVWVTDRATPLIIVLFDSVPLAVNMTCEEMSIYGIQLPLSLASSIAVSAFLPKRWLEAGLPY